MTPHFLTIFGVYPSLNVLIIVLIYVLCRVNDLGANNA
jgi:hypothetical protein